MNCPVCERRMAVKKYKGFAINVCQEHGVWLSKGELEAIDTKFRVKLRRKAQFAEESKKVAKRKGKIEGMVFRVWSLLWD